MAYPLFLSPADNRFVTGTLSATSEESSAPVTNLADDIGATPWQTALGITTASVDIDAGSAVSFRAGLLARTNLTESATVRMQLGATQGSAALGDSGALTGVKAGYLQWFYDFGANVSARWCRFTIADPTNPDTRLSVGLGAAGPCWQPTRGIRPTGAIGRERAMTSVVTKSGQDYSTIDWVRRFWTLELNAVPEDESFANLEELDRIAQLGGNVLFVPFPDSAYANREAVFGKLDSRERGFLGTRSMRGPWPARITERL